MRLYHISENKLINNDEYIIIEKDSVVYIKANCSYEYGYQGEMPLTTNQNIDSEVFSDFSISSISLADPVRKKYGLTHRITIRELDGISGYIYYLRLNWFNEFRIKWYKNDTIFDKIKAKERLLIAFIVIIPALISGYFLNDCKKTSNQSEVTTNEQRKMINPVKSNKSTNGLIKESDSLLSGSDTLRLDTIDIKFRK